MKITYYILNLAFISFLELGAGPIVKRDDVSTSYDSKRFGYRGLDNSTIQWTYEYDTSIKLLSPDCTYFDFPSGKSGFSQIRILFNSFDYEIFEAANYGFLMQVQCNDGQSPDDKMTKLSFLSLDNGPFVRTTIDVMQCPTGLITKMRLLSVLNTETPPKPLGPNDGWKDVYSPPCSSINNFMMVVWPKTFEEYHRP